MGSRGNLLVLDSKKTFQNIESKNLFLKFEAVASFALILKVKDCDTKRFGICRILKHKRLKHLPGRLLCITLSPLPRAFTHSCRGLRLDAFGLKNVSSLRIKSK